MSNFFDLFINFWRSLLLLLHGIKFNLFGYDVDFLSIVLSFFVIGFVVSLFWKGARA